MKPRPRIARRLGWALCNARNAMAAYGMSGGVIGAAIGYFNGTQSGGSYEPLWHWISFTLVANAVWSALLALVVIFPLFLFLFRALPPHRESSQKEAFLLCILPCAALQILGPLLAGTLYFAFPGAGKWLQTLAPGGNAGDVVGWTQMILLFGGTWLGAAVLTFVWRGAGADSGASRLLPID